MTRSHDEDGGLGHRPERSRAARVWLMHESPQASAPARTAEPTCESRCLTRRTCAQPPDSSWRLSRPGVGRMAGARLCAESSRPSGYVPRAPRRFASNASDPAWPVGTFARRRRTRAGGRHCARSGSQVLKPIVRCNAVDVVEDQRHAQPAPLLTLPAELAAAGLQPLGVEPFLQRASRIGGVPDENLHERHGSTLVTSKRAQPSSRRVEVVCRDVPDLLDVSPQRLVVAARWSHTEPSQRIGIRLRFRDRLANLLLGESWSPWHEHMFAPVPDRIAALTDVARKARCLAGAYPELAPWGVV